MGHYAPPGIKGLKPNSVFISKVKCGKYLLAADEDKSLTRSIKLNLMTEASFQKQRSYLLLLTCQTLKLKTLIKKVKFMIEKPLSSVTLVFSVN